MNATVAVTGSRRRTPTGTEMVEFYELWDGLEANRLIHGDCRGTDVAVAGWMRLKAAVDNRPDWTQQAYGVKHELDGSWPGAGPRRNRRMLLAERAGLVIVVAFPGGRGTQSCVDIAEELGIPVYRIEETS
jgi:hypothetical protein